MCVYLGAGETRPHTHQTQKQSEGWIWPRQADLPVWLQAKWREHLHEPTTGVSRLALQISLTIMAARGCVCVTSFNREALRFRLERASRIGTVSWVFSWSNVLQRKAESHNYHHTSPVQIKCHSGRHTWVLWLRRCAGSPPVSPADWW